jgi:hypothetical protein
MLLMPALLIAVAGCGGDSPTASEGPSARFIPEAAVGGNAILLSNTVNIGTFLVLDVQVVEVENLHFATFDLAFPSHVLSLNEAREGGYLSNFGVEPVEFVVSESPGVVSIDVRRLGDPPGLSGSGRLVSLRFQVIGEGSGDLVFRQTRATDPSRTEIPGLVWLGGRVENDF